MDFWGHLGGLLLSSQKDPTTNPPSDSDPSLPPPASCLFGIRYVRSLKGLDSDFQNQIGSESDSFGIRLARYQIGLISGRVSVSFILLSQN